MIEIVRSSRKIEKMIGHNGGIASKSGSQLFAAYRSDIVSLRQDRTNLRNLIFTQLTEICTVPPHFGCTFSIRIAVQAALRFSNLLLGKLANMVDQNASIAFPPSQRLTALDCTMRDGGYYNDWQFSLEFAQQYLHTADQAGIDIVEIGFRHATPEPQQGPFASSHDPLLKQLQYPERLNVAIMINFSDLLSDSEPIADAVNRFFGPRDQSPANWVRVATHFKSLEQVPTVVDMLHDLGYQVGVNLMQAANRTLSEIEDAARYVGKSSPEVLYFADSLGNMDPQLVENIANALFQSWPGEVGFHAHNNRGLALANTLAAANCGVTWLDSTLMGMGRGAGNCATEFLLTELTAYNVPCNPSALHPFIQQYMLPLMNQYNWGPNLLYSMAAQKGIHPTYIQQIIAHEQQVGKNINIGQMFEIFSSSENVSSVNKEVLHTIFESCFQDQSAAFPKKKAG